MFMQCVDVLVCCFRFSYHRTEGQELSTSCVGRGTKSIRIVFYGTPTLLSRFLGLLHVCFVLHEIMYNSMVSVIIPVYNTGRNLEKCLKSILSQTYKDWECIIVNDCSTDVVTIGIMKKWRRMSSSFIFIDKETNEGVDRARFSGLSMAKGDFLFFVDSDDWLEIDALEVMVEKAKETGVDMVVGKAYKNYIGGFSKKGLLAPAEWMERVICHEELMDKYYISFFGCNILPVNVWATLYKRKLIEKAGLSPCELKFGEDLVFNMKIFPFVQKYFAMNRFVYHYRIGLPLSSNKYLDSWLENARMLYTIKIQVIEEFAYKKAEFYQKVELVNYLKTYVNGCIKFRKERKEEDIDCLQRELKESIYKGLLELINSSYKDKDVVTLLARGDAESFYELMEQRYKKRPFHQRALDGIVKIVKGIT